MLVKALHAIGLTNGTDEEIARFSREATPAAMRSAATFTWAWGTTVVAAVAFSVSLGQYLNNRNLAQVIAQKETDRQARREAIAQVTRLQQKLEGQSDTTRARLARLEEDAKGIVAVKDRERFQMLIREVRESQDELDASVTELRSPSVTLAVRG